MIKKANGGREVTAVMLKKSGRVKVSTKVMRKRLSEQEGVDWYAMRLKPNLTDKDIEDRYHGQMEAYTMGFNSMYIEAICKNSNK